MRGHEGLVRGAPPERRAEGGRVGRVAAGLGAIGDALREGVAPATRQNPRGLPMDEASRRARAEALGYDLGDVRYHGTSADADFRAFRQKDRGVWTTSDPREASVYARDNDSQGYRDGQPVNTASRVIPVVSRAENPRGLTRSEIDAIRLAPGVSGYQRAQARVFRGAAREGHDQIDLGSGVRADLDVRNLRSPHATFDPQRAHEADLLAGIGAFGAGVGGAAAFEGLVGGDQGEPARYAEGGRVGRVVRGLGAVGEGIRAFHGSPHAFDRFDLSRIGTGEGVQAYGHGLYFAENEDVARAYRDRTSFPRSMFRGLPLSAIAPGSRETDEGFARYHLLGYGSAEDALSSARGDVRRALQEGDREYARDRLRVYNRLRGLTQELEPHPDASMYEVRLHVDPDSLLDWDRALYEQPQRVRDAVFDAAQARPEDAEHASVMRRMVATRTPYLSGAEAYRAAGGDTDPAGLSQRLRAAGVPGMRYYDAGSRSPVMIPQGTSNFVMFDDEPIEIIRRYATGGLADAPGYEGGGRVGQIRDLYRGLGRPMVEGLRRFLDERPIGIGAREDAAESILREGRFRTQFETGRSGGSYDPVRRLQAEAELLGVPSNAPVEQRPVYGALRSAIEDELPGLQRTPRGEMRGAWEAPTFYGNHVFLLRPEAKARSTYTLDDSLIMSPSGSGRPADEYGAAGRPYRFSEVPRARDLAEAWLAGGVGNRLDGRPSAAEWSRLNHLQREREFAVRQGMAQDVFSLRALSSPYVETQTPGPVGTDDVAALLVPGYGGREDAIRDYARGRGIPVHQHYDVERDRDLQRALGLRLVPGAVGAGAAFEGLVGRDDEPGERYADGGRVGLITRGLDAALRAFHGSPHAFDRFSLDHIGRGEGAQAYGHGLYFAENEAVARHYRDALARTSRAYNAVDGQRFTDAVRRRIEAEDPDLAQFMRSWVGTREHRSADLIPRLKARQQSVDEQLAMFRDHRAQAARRMEEEAAGGPRSIGGWSLQEYDDRIRGLEGRAAELARVMPRLERVPERRHAHMYEVRLHVDPDSLLDWDAPLASQPGHVRDAVLDVARDAVNRAPEDLRGYPGAITPAHVDRLSADDTIGGGSAVRMLGAYPLHPREASAALLERGIPGVRYLDGVSRRTGQGNRNFVMFDDEPVEIVRRYAVGGLAGAPGAVGDPADAPGPGDDVAHTQGATERGLAQAASMWATAGDVLRGGM